ncbi:MAG TPA: phage tail tape measure protein, partial [Lysobacter sp.]
MANALRLQVILAAIDKATGPFKNITVGSKGATKALRDSQAALKAFNESQKKLDQFRTLKRGVRETSDALEQAKAKLHAVSAEVRASETVSRKLSSQHRAAARAVDELTRRHARQQTTLNATRRELDAAGIGTTRLGRAQRALRADLAAASAAVDEQKKRLWRLHQAQERARKMHGGGMTAVGHGAGAVYAGQRALRGAAAPLGAAMSFESAMADVRKVVDFETPAAFAQMSRDVEDLSMRLPMAATDIAKMVAAAGQANVARGELLRFTEDASKMGVAFDIAAEEAGTTMATWRTAFRLTQDGAVKLADQINYLGNTGPANATKITGIVNRIGALGEVGGLVAGQVAALGATIAGMGVQEEVAGTGIKNMIVRLTAGASATKAQRKVFQQLGLDAVVMAGRMQKDAGGAIIDVLKRIRKLPKAMQNAALSQLFGTESVGAIAPLLTNLELLDANFAKVGDATKYAGSMQREYDSRVATSENSLQLLKNTALVLAQSVGATLIPDFKTFAARTGAVVEKVVTWIRENPRLVKGLALAAIAGSALVTVMGGLLIAGGMAAMAFSQMHNAVMLLSGGGGLAGLRANLAGLAARGIGMLTGGAKGLIAVLGGISAPVLAIAAVIALVAAVVWKYWGPIKAFLGGMWEGFVEAMGPVRQALAPLQPVWAAISGALGKAWAWIKQLLTPFQATNAQLSAAAGYGRTFGNVLAFLVSGPIRAAMAGFNMLAGAWKVVVGIFTGDGAAIRAGLQAMWTSINGILGGWPAKMLKAGVDMLNGLVQGITSRIGAVTGALSGVSGAAIGKLKSLLGIHSPSRVFAGLGGYTMQGFAVGLQRGQREPLGRMQAFGDRLRQAGAGAALAAA